MDRIRLNDLLRFSESQRQNIKIKFNQWNGERDPIELYQEDPDVVNNQWLFWRAKTRYFYPGQIAICLLKLSGDTWLLTTIKRVVEELGIYDGVNYIGEELTEYSALYGRVVIEYHKTTMAQGRYYKEICDDLVVQQILPAKYDGEDFPGYDMVRLSYHQLASIINRGKRDWIAAIENQKAIYLITDKATGKLYVGSATSSNGMLLARWRSYIENGHGGNKDLIKLIADKGFDYVKANFQYTILENYNSKVDDHIILSRENWWKDTLQSRKFGYNRN